MKTLTKSNFLVGLKCPKHLWCLFNAPEMIPPPDASLQLLFDQGHEVGGYAKKNYAGGVEVDWAKGFENTVKITKELLKLKKPVFEASFEFENNYCRADILVPVKDGWDLVEVKSTTHVKEDHYPDVAFQKYCIEGNGVKIKKCYLMHLNKEYVLKGGVDAKKLFTVTDITEEVGKIEISSKIEEMIKVVKGKMPKPALGTECINPAECPVCMNDLPEHNVTQLYLFGKKAYELINDGIVLIKDLPADFELTDKQQVQKKTVLSGEPHVNAKELKKFFKTLKYPLYFLDFETIGPAIPLFEGTRPYQAIPFQLSLHKIGEKTEHFEFLASDANDPRDGIINALKNIGSTGTVLAYNMTFEKRVIKELLAVYPKEKWLSSIIERMNDLIIPFRNFWYYDAKQHGSNSIKNVLPALTGKNYSHLEISKGDQAASKFLQTNYKEHKQDAGLRKALLEYCKQDTQGMIDILKVIEKAE